MTPVGGDQAAALGSVAVQTFAGASLIRQGPGTAVSADGLILTNIVAAPYGTGGYVYQIATPRGDVLRAKWVAWDKATGLTLLKAEATNLDAVLFDAARGLVRGQSLEAIAAQVLFSKFVTPASPRLGRFRYRRRRGDALAGPFVGRDVQRSPARRSVKPLSRYPAVQLRARIHPRDDHQRISGIVSCTNGTTVTERYYRPMDSTIERQAIRAAVALAAASAHGTSAEVIADLRDEAAQLISLCASPATAPDTLRTWCDDAGTLVTRLVTAGGIPEEQVLQVSAAVLRLRLAAARVATSVADAKEQTGSGRKTADEPKPVKLNANLKRVRDYIGEHPGVRTKDVVDGLTGTFSARSVKRYLAELVSLSVVRRSEPSPTAVFLFGESA